MLKTQLWIVITGVLAGLTASAQTINSGSTGADGDPGGVCGTLLRNPTAGAGPGFGVAGGSAGHVIAPAFAGGRAYGDAVLVPIRGGSGGGGANANAGGGVSTGCGGGAGGGA